MSKSHRRRLLDVRVADAQTIDSLLFILTKSERRDRGAHEFGKRARRLRALDIVNRAVVIERAFGVATRRLDRHVDDAFVRVCAIPMR